MPRLIESGLCWGLPFAILAAPPLCPLLSAAQGPEQQTISNQEIRHRAVQRIDLTEELADAIDLQWKHRLVGCTLVLVVNAESSRE